VKLSRKSDYALRALLHLATETGPDPVPVSRLSERNAIPRKFLEAIMRDLRELGLVESIAGKNGGYRLLLPPDEVRIGRILRHFDGHLESFEADLEHLEGPEDDPRLRVQRILRDIGQAVDQLMNETTLDNVVSGAPIRYSISNRELYHDGGGI
jgi:Rrf2 family protein